MRRVQIAKYNDFIYTSARVKVIETDQIGTVEDIFRKYDEDGKEKGVTVMVKLVYHQFSKPFSPQQLSKLYYGRNF